MTKIIIEGTLPSYDPDTLDRITNDLDRRGNQLKRDMRESMRKAIEKSLTMKP